MSETTVKQQVMIQETTIERDVMVQETNTDPVPAVNTAAVNVPQSPPSEMNGN